MCEYGRRVTAVTPAIHMVNKRHKMDELLFGVIWHNQNVRRQWTAAQIM